jgi:MinD-like ATPase involved in chromosome partitioning or flagellar assembly
LHALADFVVVDGGCGVTPGALSLWRAADLVIAVSTIDSVAIMDTYALVKSVSGLAAGQTLPPLATLINQTAGDAAAGEAHQRIATSCRRFLNLAVGRVGHIPWDSRVPAAAGVGKPFALSGSDSGAGQAVRSVAKSLASLSPRGEESLRVASR